ncbi:hypothetical protein IAR50_005556 [Cryptococcus sp. DSM 104548]
MMPVRNAYYDNIGVFDRDVDAYDILNNMVASSGLLRADSRVVRRTKYITCAADCGIRFAASRSWVTASNLSIVFASGRRKELDAADEVNGACGAWEIDLALEPVKVEVREGQSPPRPFYGPLRRLGICNDERIGQGILLTLIKDAFPSLRVFSSSFISQRDYPNQTHSTRAPQPESPNESTNLSQRRHSNWHGPSSCILPPRLFGTHSIRYSLPNLVAKGKHLMLSLALCASKRFPSLFLLSMPPHANGQGRRPGGTRSADHPNRSGSTRCFARVRAPPFWLVIAGSEDQNSRFVGVDNHLGRALTALAAALTMNQKPLGIATLPNIGDVVKLSLRLHSASPAMQALVKPILKGRPTVIFNQIDVTFVWLGQATNGATWYREVWEGVIALLKKVLVVKYDLIFAYPLYKVFVYVSTTMMSILAFPLPFQSLPYTLDEILLQEVAGR